MAQRSSGCLTIGGIPIFLAAIVIFFFTQARLPFDHQPSPVRNDATSVSPAASVVSAVEHSSALMDAQTLAEMEQSLTPAQRQRGSWEDPFVLDLWQASGWSFDGSVMRPLAAKSSAAADTITDRSTGRVLPASVATFRRPYSQLVMSLTVASVPGRSITGAAAVTETSDTTDSLKPLLTVELLPQDADSRLLIALSESSLDVRTDSALGSQALASSESSSSQDDPQDTSDHETSLTIALTPNRLLIRRAGRLLINVQRPVSIAGKACFISLKAGPRLAYVGDLRFEGE
jgi:hypothetical protein